MDFRWNDWNLGHIAEHGVSPDEVEFVVEGARLPFPRYEGNGKYRVWGQAADGYFLQVVFIYDATGEIFVIHARPLDSHEKRIYRRSQK